MLRVLPGVRKGVETHIQVSGLRFQCSLHLTIHLLRFRSSLSLRCKLAIVFFFFFFFNAIVLFIPEPWFLHNGEKQSWTMFLPKAGSGIIGEPCGNGRTFQCGIYLPLPPSPDPRLLNPAPCPLAWPLSGTVTPLPLPVLHWATHRCVPCHSNVIGMLQACSGMFKAWPFPLGCLCHTGQVASGPGHPHAVFSSGAEWRRCLVPQPQSLVRKKLKATQFWLISL